MNQKIMVFIPMYNCEKQITRVLENFNTEIQQFFCEVVVIDNRSNDNSVDSARSALASLKYVRTTLIQNDENFSLGGSIKVAFNYAIDNQYDYVITLHGDDQGDVRDITPFIKSNELEDYDIVVGSRFHPDSELVGYSKFRIIGNIVVNALCSFVTGIKIYDMIAGLNIFKTSFLKNRFYLQFPNNLTFDAHLLLYAIKEQRNVKYLPITWKEEDQVSNAKTIKQGLTLLKLFYMYFRNKESIFTDEENEFSGKAYTYQILYQNK